MERESVTRNVVVCRTEVSETGSQLSVLADNMMLYTTAVLFMLSTVVRSEPDQLLTYRYVQFCRCTVYDLVRCQFSKHYA